VNTGQYHNWVRYHIPNLKTVQSQEEQLEFVGLCKAMHADNIEGFAYLCQALQESDTPTAHAVLDPATGEFLEHCQLRWDPFYKTTWDNS
jgi:hypothetical protein